ncbi:MAG: serine/threonine protein kinase, partial [Rubrivivax sp.]
MPRSPEDDNDRTIISTAFGDSDLPQFVSSSSMFNHTLPDGTRLGEFEIKGLIGEGGFGIVYLAHDLSLQRQVALKEYMPSSLAARSSTTATVSVKSDRHRETFQAGLRSFVNEARLLAQFDHPSLVKVYRFWEDHGTAYMVMPYYVGPTLKRALAELGRPPTEAELKAWLGPLMDALEVMHAAHCFHRDIAPDNILLTASGPLLLDFGAARRVIGDMTHALTVVLKPGYAPIEQYGEESSSMPQGAWTDLYALACVVYYAITGKAPMSSVDRLINDKLRPLSQLAAGQYSPAFLQAMDAALSVRPEGRPQNVAQLRALMNTPSGSVAVVEPPSLPEPGAEPAQTVLSGKHEPAFVPATVPQTAPMAKPQSQGSPTSADRPGPPAVHAPATPPSAARKKPWWTLPGVLILVALAGVAWWFATRQKLADPALADSPVKAPSMIASAPTSTPASAPRAAPAPVVQAVPTEAPAASVAMPHPARVEPVASKPNPRPTPKP